MVLPAPVFEAGATLETVDRELCTVLHGAPTMFIAELNHPDFDQFDLSSLRDGFMAGAPCPIDLMKQVNTRMYMRHIVCGYG
jgi:fatty-acyl-CoA synthase